MTLYDQTYIIEKDKLSRDIKEMRWELVRMEELKWEFIWELEVTQQKAFTEKLKRKNFDERNQITSWERQYM